jgi:hypothetical protein
MFTFSHEIGGWRRRLDPPLGLQSAGDLSRILRLRTVEPEGSA